MVQGKPQELLKGDSPRLRTEWFINNILGYLLNFAKKLYILQH